MKMKDLASALKVSPSTVSLVVNNRPGISEATRNKVREAIKELGCEELLTEPEKVKKDILFFVYHTHGASSSGTPYFPQLFSEIIEGIDSQVKARGYRLRITYTDKETIKEEIASLPEGEISGILILAAEMTAEEIGLLDEIKIPIVLIDNYAEMEKYDCITINNEQGIYELVRHLYEMGHREIGYLHVKRNINNFMERYFGYLTALERIGLKRCDEYIFAVETKGGEVALEEIRSVISQSKNYLPSAIVADNDIVAMYTMRAIREIGLRIPEDVSVVGFDNMTLSEMLDPPLTTIHISKFRMGTAAVNLLIDNMEYPVLDHVKTEIGVQLIKRKSVRNLR